MLFAIILGDFGTLLFEEHDMGNWNNNFQTKLTEEKWSPFMNYQQT